MLTHLNSAVIIGIDAHLIEVEVDLCSRTFPNWHTVGLAESEVKESKQRVVAAIRNSGFVYQQRHVTINLAPADIKKEGTAFDLPIALGLMAPQHKLDPEVIQNFLIVGELSLNGRLRPIRGVLPMAILARSKKLKGIIVPYENRAQAAMVEGLKVYAAKSLSEAILFLKDETTLTPFIPEPIPSSQTQDWLDFNDVRGQFMVKRALEIAAAGNHNVLLVGNPGVGKTMLASRLPSILPPLSFDEALETSRIYSVVNLLEKDRGLLTQRPFRSPHHSISDAGLIGGGTYPRPGEVSLAHNGILFLDELPEFRKNVLELLRQPIEGGEVTITRAAQSLTYPARFSLVAAMNPCPCGYLGHPKINCVCREQQMARYRQRLSGPLLDRIDLQIEVPLVSFDEMALKNHQAESSQTIRSRVVTARQKQRERFGKKTIKLNAQMGPKDLEHYCEVSDEDKKLLKNVVEKFNFSARSLHRILKVARTISDLANSPKIKTDHLFEAVRYRSLDRQIYS